MTKKVNSDIFCERSGTCIMKSYNNGEDVIIIAKDLHTDPVTIFEAKNKPKKSHRGRKKWMSTKRSKERRSSPTSEN